MAVGGSGTVGVLEGVGVSVGITILNKGVGLISLVGGLLGCGVSEMVGELIG